MVIGQYRVYVNLRTTTEGVDTTGTVYAKTFSISIKKKFCSEVQK